MLSNTHYNQFPIIIIIGEILFLALLVYSYILSIFLFSMLLLLFVFWLFPEAGIALVFTGNLLLYLLFDFVKVDVVAPVIIVYLFIMIYCSFVIISRDHLFVVKQNSPFLIISILVGILLLFGLLYSNNKSYGQYKVIFYILINIPVLYVAQLCFRNDDRIIKLLKFGYLFGIILGLISLVLLRNFNIDSFRFSPSESINPIFLARSLGVSLLCGFFVFAKQKSRFNKIFLALSFLVLIFPIIWSGSRGPLIGLFFSCLLFYLLQPSQSFKRKFLVVLISFIGIVVFLFVFGAFITQRILTPVSEEASAAFRIFAWFKAIQNFISSPLLGIGTGSFILNTPWIQLYYPHNIILELACENGILGVILIGAFVLFIFKYIKKNMRLVKEGKMDAQLNAAIICVCLFMLWNAMLSGDIFKNEIVWFSAGLIWVLNTVSIE